MDLNLTNLSELCVSKACSTFGTKSTGSTSNDVPPTASAGEPILDLLDGGAAPKLVEPSRLRSTPVKHESKKNHTTMIKAKVCVYVCYFTSSHNIRSDFSKMCMELADTLINT